MDVSYPILTSPESARDASEPTFPGSTVEPKFPSPAGFKPEHVSHFLIFTFLSICSIPKIRGYHHVGRCGDAVLDTARRANELHLRAGPNVYPRQSVKRPATVLVP